eukprot:3941155-Rhodomonas_salina.3
MRVGRYARTLGEGPRPSPCTLLSPGSPIAAYAPSVPDIAAIGTACAMQVPGIAEHWRREIADFTSRAALTAFNVRPTLWSGTPPCRSAIQ